MEGNNTNSDMWALEHMKTGGFAEPSLDAVDEYNRYEEDILLMEKAGLNAYRFSIEWARIEPEKGVFDEKEMQHYLDEIACCKAHGIEPIVTLHHFSSPKWLMTRGGWEAETTPDDFEEYVRYCIQHIGTQVKYICTINEANMGIQVASVAKKIVMAMMAKQAQGGAGEGAQSSADGQIQMGINLEEILKARAEADKEEAQALCSGFLCTGPALRWRTALPAWRKFTESRKQTPLFFGGQNGIKGAGSNVPSGVPRARLATQLKEGQPCILSPGGVLEVGSGNCVMEYRTATA